MPKRDEKQLHKVTFSLNELLGYRLTHLAASIGTLAEREARSTAGLTLPEYRVLIALSAQGPLGVSDLQRLMQIDKAWVSRNLAKLVARQLISAQHHEHDGRRSLYATTPTGEEAARELIRKALDRQQRVLAGFDEKEKATLVDMLSRLQHNVDAQIKEA